MYNRYEYIRRRAKELSRLCWLSHKVSINNEIFDVVGRICMDQCMVRIDKDIDIKIGDEVIIFGESNINADNIAIII